MKSDRADAVPSAKVQKNFGFYQDEAAKAPVVISRKGRPRTVLLSIDEYSRLARRDRRAYGLDDLPESIRSAILDAEVPDGLDEACSRGITQIDHVSASGPPIAGTVLRCSYLWRRESETGREEGGKDRPVALLLANVPVDGTCVVLPITHADPSSPGTTIEIPEAERRRLGLDDAPSWIVLTEFNVFRWPGPDLRPIAGRSPRTVIYGTLSRPFFGRVLAQAKALLRAGAVGGTPRS